MSVRKIPISKHEIDTLVSLISCLREYHNFAKGYIPEDAEEGEEYQNSSVLIIETLLDSIAFKELEQTLLIRWKSESTAEELERFKRDALYRILININNQAPRYIISQIFEEIKILYKDTQLSHLANIETLIREPDFYKPESLRKLNNALLHLLAIL